MFNKINSKIKQIGFRKTIHLIIEKLIVKIRIDFNFTLNRKNPLKQEWIRYWKSYSFFERKYKNIILNMKKKEMTNQYSNKVWWCWLQGEENAPLLQQKCLESLRNNLKDREVIVITNKNLYEYVDFPDYIKDKYERGIISNTHFSDLIRLELLIRYGGTWIDSTAYCTGYDQIFFDKTLFVYKNCNYIWYANKDKFNIEPMIADNWFITSSVGNPILEAVRDLLFHYWKNNNYLPHLLQSVCLENYDSVKYDEIKNQSCFHKLTHKIDKDKIGKDSFYNYVLNGKGE